MLRFHLLNQSQGVARGWRNARLRLHIAGHLDTESLGKVRPGLVKRNHFSAAKGRHLLAPDLFRRRQTGVEFLVTLSEIGCILGPQFGELCNNSLRHGPPVLRIEPEVWIAQWMNVA